MGVKEYLQLNILIIYWLKLQDVAVFSQLYLQYRLLPVLVRQQLRPWAHLRAHPQLL